MTRFVPPMRSRRILCAILYRSHPENIRSSFRQKQPGSLRMNHSGTSPNPTSCSRTNQCAMSGSSAKPSARPFYLLLTVAPSLAADMSRMTTREPAHARIILSKTAYWQDGCTVYRLPPHSVSLLPAMHVRPTVHSSRSCA